MPIFYYMPKIKMLSAVFLGMLTYVIISYFGGRDGLWAERQLQIQKQEIGVRTAEITDINTELRLEYEGLKNDPDVIAAHARKLGYVSEGERLVKINGLPSIARTVYDAGTTLKRGELRFIPEWVCKLAGMSVTALMLFFFLLSGLYERARRR